MRAWYMVVRAKRCQPQLSDSVDARRTEGTDGNRNKGKRKDNSEDNNKHHSVVVIDSDIPPLPNIS